jgi:hypothetical protein
MGLFADLDPQALSEHALERRDVTAGGPELELGVARRA